MYYDIAQYVLATDGDMYRFLCQRYEIFHFNEFHSVE